MASLILRLDEGDLTIDRSTGILQRHTGYQVVTATNNLDKLADIAKGEKLIINGHGDPTSLGGHSTSSLAQLVAKGGLRGPVEIELIACETGWGGAPFALEFKVAMVQGHKIMCSVSAPTHFVSILDDATRYVDKDVVAADGSVVPTPVTGNKAFYKTTKAF